MFVVVYGPPFPLTSDQLVVLATPNAVVIDDAPAFPSVPLIVP